MLRLKCIHTKKNNTLLVHGIASFHMNHMILIAALLLFFLLFPSFLMLFLVPSRLSSLVYPLLVPLPPPASHLLSDRLGIVEKPIKRNEACRPLLGPDGKFLYPCGYCQKTFCSLSDLNRHMNFHEGTY